MSIIFKIAKYLKENKNVVKNLIIMTLMVSLILTYVGMSKSYRDMSTKYQNDLNSLKSQITEITEQNEELLLEKAKLTEKVEAKEEFTIDDIYDSKYPEATYIWYRLKATGLSDKVAAGVLGNIMQECAGPGSLDLHVFADNGCYGICQWVGPRKQRLFKDFGKSLKDQVDFLIVEINEIFREGHKFYSLKSEKEAALYFAKYFERCGSESYVVRQNNASVALNYFTSVN